MSYDTSYGIGYEAPYTGDNDNRIARMIAHGGTLFGWFLAPLTVYLVTRGGHPRVSNEAFQALVWSALGTIVSVCTCGLAIPIFFYWHLKGAYRAMNGEPFDYPLVAEFAARHG